MRRLILICVFALAANPCPARIITVDDDGPADYNNIQAAIDLARDGDTVEVQVGIYTGPGNRDIDFLGKAITVRSTDPNDPSIVAATIIDCNGDYGDRHRGLVFRSFETRSSLVAGLTITNGLGPEDGPYYDNSVGGAILCKYSSPTISRCTIVQNAAQLGGGVYCYGEYLEGDSWSCEPNIVNCSFGYNHASYGGGIACYQADPVLFNCAFSQNSAWRSGGAMCNEENSRPTLVDCTFTENAAYGWWHRGYFHDGDGAGIFNWAGASPSLLNCTFANNFAEGRGGGIYNWRYPYYPLTITLYNCVFNKNSAGFGGGIATWGSDANLVNCVFTENCAVTGGGMHITGGQTKLSNSVFRANSTSEGDGGAIFDLSQRLTAESCTFCENWAANAGGAIYSDDGRPSLINCAFCKNWAEQYGGALAVQGARTDAKVMNCVFTCNYAPNGSALACLSYYGCTNLPITNSILWDGGNEVWNAASSITYSDVQGGFPGEGNIDADPCFAFEADWHLMPGSPCIDTGTNTPDGNLPEYDFDGTPRPLDGDGDSISVVDMGMYEYNLNGPCIGVSARELLFVKGHKEGPQKLQIRNCGGLPLNWQIAEDCNWFRASPDSGISTGDINELSLTVDANGTAPGLNHCALNVVDPNAINSPVTIDVSLYVPCVRHVPADYNTIQAAIDAAGPFDTVIIAPGTYNGPGNRDLDFKGKPITVRSIDPNDPNIVAATIIDCNGTDDDRHRGFFFHSGEDANSIMEGLTITRCYAPGYPEWPLTWPLPVWMYPCPGPFACNEIDPSTWQYSEGTPVNTEISVEDSYGAAIRCAGDTPFEPAPGPTIRNCVITSNIGGGIFGCTGPIVNCTVSVNVGAALFNCNSPIVNCMISRNWAVWEDAIMTDCNGPVTNCLISDNWGDYLLTNCAYPLTNCTITGNLLLAEPPSPGPWPPPWWEPWPEPSPSIYPATVRNCVIQGNSYSSGIRHYDCCSPEYSRLECNVSNPTSITSDPLFVRPGYWGHVDDPNIVVGPWDANRIWVEGDYRLQRRSPCIDSGNNAYIAPDVADLDGDGDTSEPVPFDLEGKPRIIDGIPDGDLVVDMGAYETITEPRTHYVDADAGGTNDGSSWEDAFNYLQDAFPAVIYGDEIHVAAGIYRPDCNSDAPLGTGIRSAAFEPTNGVALRGGYAGSGEPEPNERNIRLNETILSGDLNGDDGPGFTNYADNAYHVVCCNSCDEETILDGFTITGGCADGMSYSNSGGAGMILYSSGLLVTNCTFRANLAIGGAGLVNVASAPLLRNCAFTGNSAYNGGALFNTQSSPTLVNCTLSGNFAAKVGGISSSSSSSPTLTGCILWGNQDNTGCGQTAQIFEGTPSVDYSCIQGWTGALGGTGNSGSDPLFVDANGPDAIAGTEDDNLRLAPLSPCIDAGDPNYVAEANETDLAGNPRTVGGRVDMGAYECDYLEIAVRFTPQALNPCSRQRWIKAHCALPAPLTVEDVDCNEPVVIYPFGIEAVDVNLFVNDQNSVEIVAKFARSGLPPLWMTGTEPLEMVLAGSLVTGRQFYGVGSVSIVQRNLKCIAVLASHWLAQGCTAPDWCEGLDLDQNGTVNFADFALSDGCCIEVVTE